MERIVTLMIMMMIMTQSQCDEQSKQCKAGKRGAEELSDGDEGILLVTEQKCIVILFFWVWEGGVVHENGSTKLGGRWKTEGSQLGKMNQKDRIKLSR